jgi:hypothetical protein
MSHLLIREHLVSAGPGVHICEEQICFCKTTANHAFSYALNTNFTMDTLAVLAVIAKEKNYEQLEMWLNPEDSHLSMHKNGAVIDVHILGRIVISLHDNISSVNPSTKYPNTLYEDALWLEFENFFNDVMRNNI